MTTQRSSFNCRMARIRPFVKNTLRERRGTFVFYLVLALFTFPAQYGIELYQYYTRYFGMTERPWYTRLLDSLGGPAECYNAISLVFFTALIMAVPVILSTALSSYMHNRRMVDVYHSLPLTREDLFIANAITAVIIMWVPLVICYLLTALMAAFVPTASPAAILIEMLFAMVMMLSIYAITSFVGTQVGTMLDQVLFTAVFSVSLFGVFVVLEQFAGVYLYGYCTIDSMYELAYMLCPFVMLIRRLGLGNTTNPLRKTYTSIEADGGINWFAANNLATVFWLVLAIVIILISARLYKRRKSEQAEVIGNLGPLQVYTRAIGTLGAGSIFGVIICEVLGFSDSGAAMTACIAVGSVIAYYIGDIILAHAVRRPKDVLPACFATVAVVCIVVGSVIFDFFGYERRVPDIADIKSITIENSRFRYSEQGWYKTDVYGTVVLTNSEAIDDIVTIHRNQLSQDESKNNSYGSMHIVYELNNGKKIERNYYGFNEESFMNFAELETNDELLTNTAAIFRTEPEDVVSVSFKNILGTREGSIVLDSQQKKELIEAVRKDLLNQPTEELTEGTDAVGVIEFEVLEYGKGSGSYTYYTVPETTYATVESTSYKDIYTTYMSYAVTESFENTIAFLEEAGAADLMENDIDDVDTIRIWLYNGYGYYTSGVFASAFPDSAPSTSWEYVYDDMTGKQIYPFCEITADEYLDISYLTNYYAYSQNSKGRGVAVLYYTDESTEPCGWHYTDIDSLPEELLERAAKAYYDANGSVPSILEGVEFEFLKEGV